MCKGELLEITSLVELTNLATAWTSGNSATMDCKSSVLFLLAHSKSCSEKEAPSLVECAIKKCRWLRRGVWRKLVRMDELEM